MNSSPPKRFILSADVEHLDVPWAHLEKLSTAELVGAEQLWMVRVAMPPGEAHNFHRHPGREEIIYVLEGQGEQWVGREKRLLGPGDMALIPANLPHATYNVSQGTLRFLAILGPVETNGPFTVDVYDEEPWASLKKPVVHPGYQPLRET